MKSPFTRAGWLPVAWLLVAAVPAARACSSCGCTLNADWAGQGIKTREGLSVDLRFDVFVQSDLRRGTGRVDAGAIALPSEMEIQRKTLNRNATLTVDYAFDSDWGIALQLPYLSRDHTTFAEGDTALSTARFSSVGDVRLLARYEGLSPDRDWGVQFGLKLPAGRIDVDFESGPQSGQPLDRGLQPGTGSTDVLLGVYRFGLLAPSFDYFGQALLQVPMTAKDDFKPGAGANLTIGVRYAGLGSVVPQLQVNVRAERRESGANADVANSGATLAYLSPGLTWHLGPRLQLYAFVQAPVYQRVNGLQLEPRASASLGLYAAY